ncbi:thioredoxin family protein [Cerasicoccus maritimus]|uniref:thioredoxin family protein n=1 Tax=Cerasicoccus maritimus TaxID=490089 RepID=UPI0028525C4A|nr:thioredoxin family protein [Cerasicoccus maritimus]
MPFLSSIFRIFIVLIYLGTVVLNAQVQRGDTRAQVIAKLGEPTGATKLGNKEILTYNGANIKLRNGVVYSVPKDFAEKQAAGKENLEYIKQQEAKGLEFYDGEWRTPGEVEKLSGQKMQGDFRDIRAGGQKMNLSKFLALGKVTVVDFYADWCGPCKQISPHLEALAKNDPSVAVRKVDIVRWGTPITEQFKIKSIPNIWVFDKNGKQVGKPTSSLSEVRNNIERAKRS